MSNGSMSNSGLTWRVWQFDSTAQAMAYLRKKGRCKGNFWTKYSVEAFQDIFTSSEG